MNNTSYLDVKVKVELELVNNVTSSEDPFFYDNANVAELVFTCITTFITGIIGIITNILNMLVLFRHGMDDSTNVVLFGLSVSDMMFSCFETYYRVASIIFRCNVILAYNIVALYIVYLMNVSTYAMSTSVWIVSIISIERMVAVCFPFYASRLITHTRMKMVVIFVYICLSFFYSPLWGNYYLQFTFDPVFNVTMLRIFEWEAYSNNHWILDILTNYLMPTFVTTTPMITILACTFATVTQLGKTSKHIGNLSTSRTQRVKEMKSIKISLIICCCMAFSILIPNNCFDVYTAIMGEETPWKLIIFIRAFTQLFVQLNASMNFFIYVALSSKFKKTFFNVIQCI